MAQPNPAVAARVQHMYADALKKAKLCLKQGKLNEAVGAMAEFFDNQEDLAQYFHCRSVLEVQEEMQDRLEQARATLAPIFAEYPQRAKTFMADLEKIIDREFEAFREMKLMEQQQAAA